MSYSKLLTVALPATFVCYTLYATDVKGLEVQCVPRGLEGQIVCKVPMLVGRVPLLKLFYSRIWPDHSKSMHVNALLMMILLMAGDDLVLLVMMM
jgi:hypothetical protein